MGDASRWHQQSSGHADHKGGDFRSPVLGRERSIFVVMAGGGRLPQGLWACGRDGTSNQRCVMHGPTVAHCSASPAEDRFVADEGFGQTNALFMARKGSVQAEILCQTADWFETREGVRQATPYHPHTRFLPSGTAVAFNGPRNIFLVEL